MELVKDNPDVLRIRLSAEDVIALATRRYCLGRSRGNEGYVKGQTTVVSIDAKNRNRLEPEVILSGLNLAVILPTLVLPTVIRGMKLGDYPAAGYQDNPITIVEFAE